MTSRFVRASFAFAVTAAASLSLPACLLGEDGNGLPATEPRPLPASVTRVRSEASLDVRIVQGAVPGVVVRIDSNLLSAVTTAASGDTLIVDVSRGIGDVLPGPHVVVTIPRLRAANLEGSGRLDAGPFQQDEPIDLTLEGSGAMTFQGQVPRATARLGGSGDLRLDGAASEIDLGLDGSGRLDARAFPSPTGALSLSGSGDLAATITSTASVSLSGSGDIDLYGGATVSPRSSEGSGDLRIH